MSPQSCLSQFSNLALQVCPINGPDNWKRLHWLENLPFARTNSNDRNFFIIQYFWAVFLASDSSWCHLKFLFTCQELITRRRSPKFECVRSRIMNFDLISNNSRLISKNCDFFKLQDLETFISGHGHMWCRSWVYLQRIGGKLCLKDFKIIKSSQGICWFWMFLITVLFKDWQIFSKHVCLALKFHLFIEHGTRVHFLMKTWLEQDVKVKAVI